jgi:outer membrane protein OmpA-like peptidoglycan-associated protein
MMRFTKLGLFFLLIICTSIAFAQGGGSKGKKKGKGTATQTSSEDDASALEVTPANAGTDSTATTTTTKTTKTKKSKKASGAVSTDSTATSTTTTTTEEKPAKKSKRAKKVAAASDSTGEATLAPAGAETTSTDSTTKIKDRQNQVQFLKPDIEATRYNFYRRKDVSTPLMMRYDLDSAVYQKGKKLSKQQQAYINRQYYFPARPKDQWEVGVNFGGAYIAGDVKPFLRKLGALENIGAGITVRKSIGYMASVRFGYNFMMSTGENWEPDANLQFNPALTGHYDPRVNYWNNQSLLKQNTSDSLNMNKLFFYNYRTYMHEFHLGLVLNVGNINFHRERSMVSFYLMGGISGLFFTTYMDALNENGDVYDFSSPMRLFYNNNNNNVNSRIKNQRKESLKRLDKIFDGKYETLAEHENNALGIKNWQFIPGGTIGVGVQFHVSKWVTLGIEERIILTGSDLLDGYRWQQDEHSGFTPNYDNISYSSINVLVNLGKNKVEPLYWLNPIHYTYKKLSDMNPEAIAEDVLKDDDDDGVPNRLDREPNSKKGCPVDTHGVMLDSDKDGIPDCDDKEPFSPPGYPVDSNGVAIIPPNPCCDTTGYYNNNGEEENINNNGGYDEHGNPVPGGAYDVNGNPVKKGGGPGGKNRKGGGYDCAKIELPAVVFDLDKYYLDPQYYGNLHQIAERMQMCPDMRLVVTGYDESRDDQKYNEQLSWNRANAAVDYLVEKYGISRDRFIIKYQGGKRAAAGTPFEKKMKSKVEFRYANEGENGDSNPPAPHPGLKAGSNK